MYFIYNEISKLTELERIQAINQCHGNITFLLSPKNHTWIDQRLVEAIEHELVGLELLGIEFSWIY